MMILDATGLMRAPSGTPVNCHDVSLVKTPADAEKVGVGCTRKDGG